MGERVCYHKKECGDAKQTKPVAKHIPHFINEITEAKCNLIPNAMLFLLPLAVGWVCRSEAESSAKERGTNGGHVPESLSLLIDTEREGGYQ